MKEVRHGGSTRCCGGLLAFTYDLADCLIAMGTDGFPLVSHGYRELAS